MRLRQLLIAVFILTITWQAAAAQPRKKNAQAGPPSLERVVAVTSAPSDTVLSEVIAVKPEMPLGPPDILKAYEIAMNLVVEKASTDFSAIAQAQQANQISRGQAEYLLQEGYQVAMMQFQVLSALHDVLKHEIDQTTEQAKSSVRKDSSDTVLVVPFPASPFESR
jgi:hypothetical protein